LRRDEAPALRVTLRLESLSCFAKKAHNATLALPSTGGACKRTFRASPCSPQISVLLARGTTWTAMRVPAPSAVIQGGMGRFMVRLSVLIVLV